MIEWRPRELRIVAAIAVASALLACGLNRLGAFDLLEGKALDLRFRLRGRTMPNPDVVLVGISDHAIRQYGRWPFSREAHGLFIEAASALGASSVVYNVNFAHPTNEDDDLVLAAMTAMAENVHFPIVFSVGSQGMASKAAVSGDTALRKFAIHQVADSSWGLVRACDVVPPPLPSIVQAACFMGFATEIQSEDVVRRVSAAVQYGDDVFLHLCIPAVACHYGIDPRAVRLSPGRELVFPGVAQAGDTVDVAVPLNRDNTITINWVGTWLDIPQFSFRDILASHQLIEMGQDPVLPREELRRLEGKILVVGRTDASSRDLCRTPFERLYRKVGIHYNLLHTLLSRQFITPVPPVWHVSVVLCLCLLLALLQHLVPGGQRIVLFALFVAPIPVAVYMLFAEYHLWVQSVSMSAALVLTFGGVMVYSYTEDNKAKRKVRLTFQRYITRDVMEKLLESTGGVMPGGEKREVSVLFSDIRGFTSLMDSEPAEVVLGLLNEYLSVMTQVIFEHRGTIDKFIGDSIMAYFGAPLYPEHHARRAVQAAVAMREQSLELRRKWVAEGRPPLEAGIGVATGEVVVGNIGSKMYMDFTLIGDDVNVASRLCGAADGGEILIDEETFIQAKKHLEVVHSEDLRVKGKPKPVRTYAVAGYVDDPRSERRRHKRREVELPILLKVVDLDEDYREVLVNISGGGMRIVGSRWMKPHTIVELKIPLPDQEPLSDIRGTVLSCDETSDGKVEARIEYTDITHKQRNRIVRYVYQVSQLEQTVG